MKTLNLTLKKKWFDMIKSGEKLEEYREVKRFWIVRLLSNLEYLTDLSGVQSIGPSFKQFDQIIFKNGYSANAPTITVECLGISIGTAKPEWSDNWQGQVFVIKLGNIIDPQTQTK